MSESYSFRYDPTALAQPTSSTAAQSQVDYSTPSASGYNTRRSTSSAALKYDIKDEDSSSVDSNQALILEKKRKNASAQAAFRARRTNYIANLEETVTSLEGVVRRLQDACRDAHDDNTELKQENVRMKAVIAGFEERERIWKAYAKATAGTPAGIAASNQLSAGPLIASHHDHSPTQPSGVKTPMSSTGSLQELPPSSNSFGEEGTVYGDEPYSFGKMEESDPSMTQHALQLYPQSGQTTAVTTSPTSMTSYPIEHDASASSLSGIPLTPSSSVDCHLGGLTSMAYAAGAPLDGQALFSVDPNMPPATSSYSNSFNLSGYGFAEFAPAPSHPHRPSLPTTLTLDSPAEPMDTTTYDLSSPDDGQDSSRPRPTRRHTYSFPSPLPPPPRRSSNTKKGSAAAETSMSNTLAVIKAQAFGNVRKTRARAKKNPTSGEAAKAALEILEARGLGLGLDIAGGVKRRKRGDLPTSSASSSSLA